MYTQAFILLISFTMAYTMDEICCVCLPRSLCENGVMTTVGTELVGSTPEAISSSGRATNIPGCKRRRFLTCCKVPWASDQCTMEETTEPPVTNQIPAETPWGAYLFRGSGEEGAVASATLIHPQALIVPAHAVSENRESKWKISLGDEQIDRMFNRYKNMAVKSIVTHPGYIKGSTANDIAIVILEDKVRNSKKYSSIMVPRRVKHLDLKTCVITGAQTGVTVKQKTVHASYIPKRKCRREHRKNVPSKSLKYLECVASPEEEELCKMKAGVSVTCKSHKLKGYNLLGIVTKNNACDTTQQTSIFIPTRHHIRWARKTIQEAVGRKITFPRRKGHVGRNRKLKFKKSNTKSQRDMLRTVSCSDC